MELQLQPLAPTCHVSGEPFVAGARVASFLVRTAALQIVTSLRQSLLRNQLRIEYEVARIVMSDAATICARRFGAGAASACR